MNVLITGANGFLGNNLVNVLKGEFSLILSVNQQIKEEGKFPVFDTSNNDGRNNWNAALNGVQSVIHLASVAHKPKLSNEDVKNINLVSLENLLTACKDNLINKFVYISTANVHGRSSNVKITEESDFYVEDYITRTRIEAEAFVKKYCELNNIKYVIIRPALILNKNAPGNIAMLSNMTKKIKYFPFGSVRNKRSYLSISKFGDFVKQCLLTDVVDNKVFLLADSKPKSLAEVLAFLAKVNDEDIINFKFPIFILKFLLYLLGQNKKVSVLLNDFEIDSSKADYILNCN